MTKERFLKNHDKTYKSLNSHLKTIILMLMNAEKEHAKCDKNFKNGSFKRKNREMKRMKEIERFVENIQVRGDKIFKLLDKIKILPSENVENAKTEVPSETPVKKSRKKKAE